MLFAYGWAIASSSRSVYEGINLADRDALDEEVELADHNLFGQLERYLGNHQAPDLDWHFRRSLNNASGVLMLSSSRNHRGQQPAALAVLHWLAEHGPSSYGLVHLLDDEDSRVTPARDGRPQIDFACSFRVCPLRDGKVEEFDDPLLSPLDNY